MKNLEFSKEKNVSNILTERKKTVVKRYSNLLCELWFSGHMHSVFFFALGHNSHGVSFWRGKMAQETWEGLYGHRHISGNVKCTCIPWKWKSVRTRGICSAALLRHTSYTYPETLGSWPTLHSKLSFLGSHFSKEKHVLCMGKLALSGKKKRGGSLRLERNFSASVGKPEWHPSTKSMPPSLFGGIFLLWFWLGFLPNSKQFLWISRYIVESILEGTHWNKDMVNTKQRI